MQRLEESLPHPWPPFLRHLLHHLSHLLRHLLRGGGGAAPLGQPEEHRRVQVGGRLAQGVQDGPVVRAQGSSYLKDK